MAYEIKIYGEIISTYDKHQGGKGVSLEDVQAKLDEAKGQDVKIRINSPGGDAQEGFAIYDEIRRYARNNKANVHTFAESNLASVATVIFLAGDVREVTKTIEPFIHNAQWGVEGDSRDLKAGAEVLERWNDKLAKHYAEHTELSYKEARELMNSDTYITPEEAKRMRFATKVEKVMRPAAMQRFSNPINNNKMSNKKGILAKVLSALGITNKQVFDAEQRTIDFYELEEDEPIEVGANATIDGQPAEGSIVMENGDTYVFAAGVLTEIIAKDDSATADDNTDEIEALKAEIEALKSENEAVAAKLEEVKVTNKTLRTAIKSFAALESEIIETKPSPRPTPSASSNNKPVKGQRFAKAIDNFKSNTK